MMKVISLLRIDRCRYLLFFLKKCLLFCNALLQSESLGKLKTIKSNRNENIKTNYPKPNDDDCRK